MLSAIREAVMRAQARAYEIHLDRDLQVLARSLMSERSPPESGCCPISTACSLGSESGQNW
jgi:hypothetical protein